MDHREGCKSLIEYFLRVVGGSKGRSSGWCTLSLLGLHVQLRFLWGDWVWGMDCSCACNGIHENVCVRNAPLCLGIV